MRRVRLHQSAASKDTAIRPQANSAFWPIRCQLLVGCITDSDVQSRAWVDGARPWARDLQLQEPSLRHAAHDLDDTTPWLGAGSIQAHTLCAARCLKPRPPSLSACHGTRNPQVRSMIAKQSRNQPSVLCLRRRRQLSLLLKSRQSPAVSARGPFKSRAAARPCLPHRRRAPRPLFDLCGL
ncbi:uncharacterized protein B0I36DRAFT_126863 [Microdochium trichocladiopsis]|uniref:Uncharacterized protein n=1 Tax=Microdochium trichocladiopsis TaxID=1682393 RepID=A0A9P9BP50_9PEZI|nr:uncharacterized protein B0I36DRAFT_126863 [Microdochium trichocladiopsis]KAH7028887.1 hypothetical protein B0I36DRAFT_126863 [Microdochium trichocladiopsis]